MLKVDGISVSYGLINALTGVSFNVNQGEFVTLLGSNGAGKTTTLNAISGVVKCKEGIISFMGQVVNRLSPARRVALGIVQVPEGGKLFPYMTVKENLFVGAYASNESWKNRHKSLNYVFELFPVLKERQKQPAGLLSGGERQMLNIGCGLMARPKLLMVDEPSLGLAPKVLSDIYAVLKTLNNEGVTILLAEQNARQALKIAETAYVLENGRITISGKTETIREDERIRKVYLGV